MKSLLLLTLLAAPAAAQALHYELDAPAGVRQYGHTLAAMGDLDGDGRPDFALSAFSMRVELRSGLDGALLGLREQAVQGYGGVLARAGDVDGDGIADLAMGAPGPFESAGTCYEGCPLPSPGFVEILSGRDASLLLHLGEQDGWDDEFGFALAALGDLDGDGHADFAVGAPAHQYHALDILEQPTGKVFAFSGATGLPLWTAQGFAPRAAFGVAIAELPDLDGDGIRDLAVGASGAYAAFGTQAPPPEVDVLSGATGTVLRRIVKPAIAGYAGWFGSRLAVVPQAVGLPHLLVGFTTTFGPAFGALVVDLNGKDLAWTPYFGSWAQGLGERVAAGDITGDGVAELLIGHSQRSELLLLDQDCTWRNSLGSYDVASFPGVYPVDANATCAAVLGDVSGDGVPDFVMGDAASGGDAFSYGRVRVFRGGPGPWTNLGQASPNNRKAPILYPAVTRAPITSWSTDAKLNVRVVVAFTDITTGFPVAEGWLVIGLQTASMPVWGGILVPAPQVLILFHAAAIVPFAEVLDADIPPGLPAGLEFFVQAVVVESSGDGAPKFSPAWRGELP